SASTSSTTTAEGLTVGWLWRRRFRRLLVRRREYTGSVDVTCSEASSTSTRGRQRDGSEAFVPFRIVRTLQAELGRHPGARAVGDQAAQKPGHLVSLAEVAMQAKM